VERGEKASDASVLSAGDLAWAESLTSLLVLLETGLMPSLAFRPLTLSALSLPLAVVALVFLPVPCVREGVFISSAIGALLFIWDMGQNYSPRLMVHDALHVPIEPSIANLVHHVLQVGQARSGCCSQFIAEIEHVFVHRRGWL
jgi:hypothetical protein